MTFSAITNKKYCAFKQHTRMHASQTNFSTQYIVFHKDRQNRIHPSGGVAIVLQRSVACQYLQLQTSPEAVAVRAIIFEKLVTVRSLYISPDYHLSNVEFENLINELPEPCIITGDFNAHNPICGSVRVDARGQLFERCVMSSECCVFNNKYPTYYNSMQHTYASVFCTCSNIFYCIYVQCRFFKCPCS